MAEDALRQPLRIKPLVQLMTDGAKVVHVTPDLDATQETSHLDRPLLRRRLYKGKATIMPDRRLTGVARDRNRLAATRVNERTDLGETVACDSVVIENGTSPVTETYDNLRPASSNDGVPDIDALAAGCKQGFTVDSADKFRLYRIGHTVASCDLHAAILDALRLCTDL